MFYSDDPLRDFEEYDRENAEWEARLPHCDYCEEAIDDYYYEIDGEILCFECLKRHYKYDVATYIEED